MSVDLSVGWIKDVARLRASQSSSETTGDGGASFVRGNPEACGYIEQNGFHIAVRQRLTRDKASEPKSSEVQSGIALTYRRTEELSFFRSESRRGIAAT
jgi:hypothetical protein